jgi:hypothetical protein
LNLRRKDEILPLPVGFVIVIAGVSEAPTGDEAGQEGEGEGEGGGEGGAKKRREE